MQVGCSGDICQVFVSIYHKHAQKHKIETNTGRKLKHCIYLPQESECLYLVHFWVLPWTWSSIPKKALAPAVETLHHEKVWTGKQKPIISDTRCFQILKHNNKTHLTYFSKSICSYQNARNWFQIITTMTIATVTRHTFFQVGIMTDRLKDKFTKACIVCTL